MPLVLSGSTGIVSANIADGTIATSDLASGAITSATLPSGSVLQVVQGVLTAWSTTTSTSLVATGCYADIVPKFSSSKILIRISANGLWNGGSTSNTIYFDLYKNGSSIAYLDRSSGNNTNPYGGSNSYEYLDSPNTTSSTRYELWFCSSSGPNAGICNYTGAGGANNRTRTTITLMEIAA